MAFANRQLSLGSWVSLGSQYAAEIMATAGFEWLVIDMEHSAANGLAKVQELIQVIDLTGCVPLVRIPENEPTIIKQVMDAGAHGVVVPMVNTAEEAQAAVHAMYYPPQGKRGVGLWRAQGYGRTFHQYREWLQENAIVIVQIEHIAAIENLKQILEVEKVNGFIVGPYDLSASLGVPGDLNHPLMESALLRILSVAEASGKWAGCHIVHPDKQALAKAIKSGYNLIAYGTDYTFLAQHVDGELAHVKKEYGVA